MKRETQLLREVRNSSMIFLLQREHSLLSVKFTERFMLTGHTHKMGPTGQEALHI